MGKPAWADSGFSSLSYLEELYQKYSEDPSSVDPSWQEAFASLRLSPETALSSSQKVYDRPVGQYAKIDKTSPADLRVYNLIQTYRTYGHLFAKFNPIATHPLAEPWQLKLETLGFASEELPALFPTCGILEKPMASLQEIIDTLRSIYCDKIGVEYMGLQSPELEEWLQQHIEPNRFRTNLRIEQKEMILEQLNRSELLEMFIHTKYTGQKRFSLEGGETLIPMLQATIETGSSLGLEQFVIGMAHRGRLNVLSNILNKSYADIFSEFEEGYIPNSFEGSGDVKYHKGFYSEVETAVGKKVKITLSPNPSHLEAVDPVVEGQVKAVQVKQGDDLVQQRSVPILIHGDAALAGQGVIYETMQFYKLPGYSTGGTIHIVINNQIGFTALPEETRSTLYCTNIARAFSAPVFHVNAEDPEGCFYVTNLAMEIRQKFHCDVFIDLNCYRKYGHNEGDEPAFTQPLEYQLIRKKKPIREIYRDQLIQQGVVERHLAEALEVEFTQALQQALQQSKLSLQKSVLEAEDKNVKQSDKLHIPTGVSKDTLKTIAERFCTIPEGFSIHPKLKNLLQERLSMVQSGPNSRPIDWGMAELLAYGSLLWEGTHVRISGQDSSRGTFSHRHAIWMDQVVEKAYSPLSHLKPGQGRFDVYNSSLSEYAVLGFEFGYSFAYPEALVVWEAQFGDFCNGAQIVIDQFIATAEQKWGQKCRLALFLPHGYEGQGPEHSSARMERFLTLSAENNMRVVNPTTPAQLFHLLRRQVLSPVLKPLITFTPKGLLRLPACTSPLEDLAEGAFQEILDDPSAPHQARRLIFCSGRVYYDLVAERSKAHLEEVAIVRIEQLHPLHKERLSEIIAQYKNVNEYIWVQEEPSNMGAWEYMHPLLREHVSKVRYVGRKRSASPAAGSYALHKKQFAELFDALKK